MLLHRESHDFTGWKVSKTSVSSPRLSVFLFASLRYIASRLLLNLPLQPLGVNMFCPQCGTENYTDAYFCPKCGRQTRYGSPVSSEGRVKTMPIPDGVRGWSWGAFIFSWIWGPFNGTPIALLALVPLVGFAMSIALGIKGREWAWKNKNWDNLDHFNRVQRVWSVCGVVFLITLFVIGILASVVIPAYQSYVVRAKMRSGIPFTEHTQAASAATPVAIGQSIKFISESELSTHLRKLMSCEPFMPNTKVCRIEFQGLQIEIPGITPGKRNGGIYVLKLGTGQELFYMGHCLVLDFKKSFPSENPYGLWVLIREDGMIRPHINAELASDFCNYLN